MNSDPQHSDADFERWYRSEHPRVVTALALAGGNVEVAREATDEAFVRAYERWQKVAAMDSPGGWLYRVAMNELKRRLRRQRLERDLLRRQRHSEATDPLPITDPRMWDAVRNLPKRQRSAIALRYVLDMTEREVAETMGVSRGAASATLTAARRNLQDVLGEDAMQPNGTTAADGLNDLSPRSQNADGRTLRSSRVQSGAVDG